MVNNSTKHNCLSPQVIQHKKRGSRHTLLEMHILACTIILIMNTVDISLLMCLVNQMYHHDEYSSQSELFSFIYFAIRTA